MIKWIKKRSEELRQEFDDDGEKWGKVNRESAYQEWLEQRLLESRSQLLASREEVLQLRGVENAAREYQEAASDALYGQGDEEDNASAYDKADEQLSAALSASPAPAKTCRWKFSDDENDSWYDTSCGHEPHGEYKLYELLYKFCPYCGLVIEEMKEETT
jgi:hypothetical protein